MSEPVAAAYWCHRGGLFTLVHARTPEGACTKAARAMGRTAEGVEAREATAADRQLWADLLAQQLAGPEGCCTERTDGVQLTMLAA